MVKIIEANTIMPQEELVTSIRLLYDEYGPRKPMGGSSLRPDQPHYFLHRSFLGDQDLLIIFNTLRCRYHCHFCDLPRKSSKTPIASENIISQFYFVVKALRNSLSVLDRLTMSNEGSILDEETFPKEALLAVAQGSHELRRVRRLVLETRLEFVLPELLAEIEERNPRATLDILTGFETLEEDIRNNVLVKEDPLRQFLDGMDRVAESGVDLTAYVLFKPDPNMTDDQAMNEAERSIDFLIEQSEKRGISLTVRLNPMYAARRTPWGVQAQRSLAYQPPLLTDVLNLAQRKRAEGLSIYLGLSIEGLADSWGTYMAREDYSKDLLKEAMIFNG